MVELVLTAKSFGIRPSNLIKGVSNYVAYCFDVACGIYDLYLQQGRKPIEWEENEL